MNLLPMFLAFVFVRISGEMSKMGEIVKTAFSPMRAGIPMLPLSRYRLYIMAYLFYWEM